MPPRLCPAALGELLCDDFDHTLLEWGFICDSLPDLPGT